MDASIQSKFKPYEAPNSHDFSSAKVNDPNATVTDSNDKDKVSFKDLLLNSNEDMERSRAAQKNGDALRMAKTDAEFAKMMAEKANQANLRKPQNELDKNAFLKLFVTQMRNQDPLNPDNSAQMAAQLAQFHGLEQMMNVNKNLEKMQTEEAMGRAVSLINFVGKEIKLDNGKLMVEGGKVTTEATADLSADAPKVTMEVRDASGVVVATKDLGPMTAGEHKIEWNGRDKDGKPVNDGAYTFAIVATDAQKQAIDAKITSTVRVTGVDLHDSGGAFYTPVGKVRITDVASVGDVGFSKDKTAPAKKASESDKDAANDKNDDHAGDQHAGVTTANSEHAPPPNVAAPAPHSEPVAAAPETATPPSQPNANEAAERQDTAIPGGLVGPGAITIPVPPMTTSG